MDKIVNIEKRLEKKKRKEHLERYRNKIRSLQRSIQCSSCHLRCAMCGFHIEAKAASDQNFKLSHGFALCEDCRVEFEDFISLSRDGVSSELFWHNTEWREMWSAWLRYRDALKAFIASPEFNLMLDELDA